MFAYFENLVCLPILEEERLVLHFKSNSSIRACRSFPVTTLVTLCNELSPPSFAPQLFIPFLAPFSFFKLVEAFIS